MRTIAIIVAGGSGTRFGAQLPKQFLDLAGQPVLIRAIAAFDQALAGMDHEIVVTLPTEHAAVWRELCARHGFAVAHRVVNGGATRWHSVKNALDTLPAAALGDVIAVHDGVRPLASIGLIRRAVDTARAKGCAIPVVPLNDSVRQLGADTGASRALDRSLLRAVQTPQAFAARLLMEAYHAEYQPSFTDDASVVESIGHTVTLIDGETDNLKITRPVDLALAEYIINHHA